MRWFRFYSEALDDPKVQLLPADVFRFWVNVLCLANVGETRGELPSIEALAFRLRIPLEDAQSHMAAIVAAHLIDIDEDGTRKPHNWDNRQHKSDNVTPRVQKHRAKQARNVTGNVTETADAPFPPLRATETEADTETETEADTETETEAEPEAEGGAVAPAASPDAVTTAEILAEKGHFIADDSGAILAAVVRSFRLVPQFQPRDGPVEAEKYCRWFGVPKRKPNDWYRAWLNWLKRAAKDSANGHKSGEIPRIGDEDYEAYKARQLQHMQPR